jgi:hypothetical protein
MWSDWVRTTQRSSSKECGIYLYVCTAEGGDNTLDERAFHLEKRSRLKCGPILASDSTLSVSSTPSVGTIRLERNVTVLEKRMELPKRSMSKFYEVELRRVTKPIVPLDHSSDTAPDMSTAVFSEVYQRARRKAVQHRY